MSTFDNLGIEDDDGDAGQVFDLIELPREELRTAWQEFKSAHILPGRLLRLAAGLEMQNEKDRHHLEWCRSCRHAYERYSSAHLPQPMTREDVTGEENGCATLRQTELWPVEAIVNFAVVSTKACAYQDDVHHPVPSLVRAHLHVPGPIVFGGDEVAFDSWQFGQLLSDDKGTGVSKKVFEIVVDSATAFLRPWMASENLLLVCFGRAMHRCGVSIAVRIGDAGFGQPHVILAHDHYSPTVICHNNEFKNADVIVLTDVVHSGTTLNGLLALCVSRGARRVRGLALVDQSNGKPLCAEWHSIWQEPQEQRMPLDAFVKQASADEIRQLCRFEPNGEVSSVSPVGISYKVSRSRANRLAMDSELMQHIHDTGALKRDHMIGGKRYPYVVNVLDLIKRNDDSKTFILQRTVEALADLRGKRVAVAFHAGRRQRAGRLAAIIGSTFDWDVISVGSGGSTFAVSDAQLRQLATFDVVVIVDAALRTGDTLSALMRAIDDKWLLKHTRFVALYVLNGLTEEARLALTLTLGIEIRALFDVPLAPPTEEVRHWTSGQKALIRNRIASSGAFSDLDELLMDYCRPAKGRRSSAKPTIHGTRELLELAQSESHGAMRIEAACIGSKPQLIRHLSVSEIVHDHNVQELLIGVMFNSVGPSLKESAALALASARNYEWMTLEWLKLNRPFISTTGQAWKSIVMVECEMKLTGRHRKLAAFRDATLEFREQEISKTKAEASQLTQLLLQDVISNEPVEPRHAALSAGSSANRVLVERLDAIISAAN